MVKYPRSLRRMERDMRTARRYRVRALFFSAVIFALLVVLLLRGFEWEKPEPEVVDPHAGQVYLYDGFDWIWMTPLEGVPVNDLTEDKFANINGKITYLGNDYIVTRGIDVSEHQYDIDWQQVAASGVDYAYIRVGRRGYTEGGLYEDPWFKKNIEGALASGLDVGVYMFSQAITVSEAMEEARFVLERIGNYRVTLPIVFDWEKIVDDPNARTASLEMQGRTDCAVAFCETVKAAGYTPCVYFNRNLGYYGYDLTRLTAYDFWFSLPESGFPNFYYAMDMWQYSFTENVPGINIPTDMNLRFVPVPKPVESLPTASD